MDNAKKILLIDLDDERRETRVRLLHHAGYEVDLRKDYIESERLDHEGKFDLVILALHTHPQLAAKYSDELTRFKPKLPVLLLTDFGARVPVGTLNPSIQAGDPGQLMREVAIMLHGSDHIREIDPPARSK